MSNIMKISQEAKALIEAIDLADGEFTQEVAQMFDALIQHGQAGLAILADVCDEVTLRQEARANKAKELSALAKKDENVIANTKKVMMAIMDVLPLEKSASGAKKILIGALSITRSAGKESVEIVDETMIPDSYKKATVTFPASELPLVRTILDGKVSKEVVEVSKTAIMDTYKEGKVEVGGTRIVRSPYLLIKG